MPDTPGYDSPFKDYIAPKPDFNVNDTLGDSPRNFPVPTARPTQFPNAAAPTPKELPEGQMDLWYGPGMNRGSGGGK